MRGPLIWPLSTWRFSWTMAAGWSPPDCTVVTPDSRSSRIRVGGTAEIAGYDLSLRKTRRGALEHSVTDLFGTGGRVEDATFWCGLRPMTPDGPPIVGRTAIEGLFLNTGHGTLGWTMACGSGRILADIVSGRAPQIDVADLGIGRYGS